jgi:hypothetical protein
VRDLQDRFPKARLIGADRDYENLVARVVGFVDPCPDGPLAFVAILDALGNQGGLQPELTAQERRLNREMKLGAIGAREIRDRNTDQADSLFSRQHTPNKNKADLVKYSLR